MSPKRENRPDRGFLELAVIFAVLLSMASLLAVALKLNDNQQAETATAAVAGPVEQVKLTIKSDEEMGKKGPDGSWHDSYLPADFSVKAGATVKVTVYNYDDMPHSFTSTALGINATIPGGSDTKPGVETFTIHAPQQAGRYLWFCALPCDPWAMEHVGFMRGYVEVEA